MRFTPDWIKAEWPVAGGILAGLGLFLLLYLPLTSRLQAQGTELAGLERELVSSRAAVDRVRDIRDGDGRIPDHRDVSGILNEITETGKGLGLDFRSIRPDSAEETSLGYRLLPVEINLEGSYRALGSYLGFLRGAQGGAVKLEKLDVQPAAPASGRLECRMNLKIVLRSL